MSKKWLKFNNNPVSELQGYYVNTVKSVPTQSIAKPIETVLTTAPISHRRYRILDEATGDTYDEKFNSTTHTSRMTLQRKNIYQSKDITTSLGRLSDSNDYKGNISQILYNNYLYYIKYTRSGTAGLSITLHFSLYKYNITTQEETLVAENFWEHHNNRHGCRIDAVIIKDSYLYCFCSGSMYSTSWSYDTVQKAFKFNLSTETYFEVTAASSYPERLELLGNNLYFFTTVTSTGSAVLGTEYNEYIYKYNLTSNTLTKTNTQIPLIGPYRNPIGSASRGNYIYISRVGTIVNDNTNTYNLYIYKYDTVNDSITQIAELDNIGTNSYYITHIKNNKLYAYKNGNAIELGIRL